MKFTSKFLWGCGAVFLVAIIVLVLSTQTGFAETKSAPVQTAMTKALKVGQLEGRRLSDPKGIKSFYDARGHEIVWAQSVFLKKGKAESIVSMLKKSWEHGLNPADYRVDDLSHRIKTAKGDEKYKLDLMLSDALVRYGQDLTGMRVSPRSIGQNSKYWRKKSAGLDILEHVAQAGDVKQAMRSLAPNGKLYKALQKELKRLYQTPEDAEAAKPITINRLIRPGSTNRAISKIRQRMGFAMPQAGQNANYYDDKLAQAVMAFQKARGANPDGVIGQHTLALLNMTRKDRLQQVLVNLERLRWVEPNKPERYIMVNVPAAMLWAVENNKVKIEMPVMVGREKRPTNIFTTQVTGIRFNPTWTVPPTIKKEDYLPKLQEDPYYLSDRGIELHANNMTLDPGQVDWTEISWEDVNALRMVQGSGSRNPLGLVRFIMNNPFNIYLHDTPKKHLFKRTNRALSSGCIRLQDAQKLADFVLEPNKNWSEERRKKILARGKMAEVRAEAPLPVYILYQTVWLGDRGQVVYGHDLYGHDRDLFKVLKNMGGLPSLEQEKVTKTARNEVEKG